MFFSQSLIPTNKKWLHYFSCVHTNATIVEPLYSNVPRAYSSVRQRIICKRTFSCMVEWGKIWSISGRYRYHSGNRCPGRDSNQLFCLMLTTTQTCCVCLPSFLKGFLKTVSCIWPTLQICNVPLHFAEINAVNVSLLKRFPAFGLQNWIVCLFLSFKKYYGTFAPYSLTIRPCSHYAVCAARLFLP
jgi:hypothetical protein